MSWKSLRFNPGSLYIAHTRSTTDGDPNINANNHPHIGEHTVMVHNGMVLSYDAIAAAHKFNMKTDCDSEILLHLAESEDDIKSGLEKMLRIVNNSSGIGSVATAFVDRRNPTEILLSRNSGNPLNIYECKRLNCIFFASTDAIFETAAFMLYGHKNLEALGISKASLDTNTLYRLKEDGTFSKQSMSVYVTHNTTNYHNSNNSSSNLTQADMRKQSAHCFAYPSIYGEDYELCLDGSISEFGINQEKEEDDDKLETVGGYKCMPNDVRKELIEYLSNMRQFT